MRVVYFTAGTAGVGDLMHGVALRRAAQRSGLPITVSLVSPPLPFPCLRDLEDHVTVAMDARALVDPRRVAETPLAQAMVALRPDVVVIGHFWTNLQCVLPLLEVEAWLLLRKAPPIWVQGPPQAPFSPSLYARRFEIEPVGFVGDFESLHPLVVVNRDEMVPAAAARQRLLGSAVDDGGPLQLVFQAGKPGESATLASSHRRPGVQQVLIDLRSPQAPWPIATLLHGADDVVTGAGYNAWWEARWLGTAAKTTWVPFARSVDDQAWRLALPSTPIAENGADQLIRMLWGRG